MSDPAPIYDRLGGAEGVERLVTRFYELMSTLPEAVTIRAMHPEQIDGSREKLREFLSGWLGGPQLYMEKRGHPRLRMRHMPYVIDDAARDAWLLCMQRALDEVVPDELLKLQLNGAFRHMAHHLRNAEQHGR